MKFRQKYLTDKLFQLLDYIGIEQITVIDIDGKYVCHGTMKVTDGGRCAIFRHSSGAAYNNFTMREVKEVSVDVEMCYVQVQLNFSKK